MENNSSISAVNSGLDEGRRDNQLWQIAKKRAAFKWSVVSYFLVHCLLITIWYLTSGPGSYFWPVWPMLGWGFGIAMQYFDAHHGSKMFSAQKEYEKLKNNQ